MNSAHLIETNQKNDYYEINYINIIVKARDNSKIYIDRAKAMEMWIKSYVDFIFDETTYNKRYKYMWDIKENLKHVFHLGCTGILISGAHSVRLEASIIYTDEKKDKQEQFISCEYDENYFEKQ